MTNSQNFLMKMDDNRYTECEIRLWVKPNTKYPIQKLILPIKNLVKNYWKSFLRTVPAGMMDLKRHLLTLKIANTTLSYYAKDNPFSLLYCDLDNFKAVNTKFGLRFGDKVIKEFGALLENLSSNFGFPLHDGGDEFLILLPYTNNSKAKQLRKKIQKRIKLHDFKTDSIKLSLSIGVATTNKKNSDFETLVDSAYNDMLLEK